MNPKFLSLLAIVSMVILASVPISESDGLGMDLDTLDDNGNGLYTHIDSCFAEMMEDPVDTVQITYVLDVPTLFSDLESAYAYATGMVSDVLAVHYVLDPSAIWLWEVPLGSIEVDVVTDNVTVIGDGKPSKWTSPVSVSFQLSVPADFVNDPATEGNEIAVAMQAVKDKMKTFEGQPHEIVRSIAGILGKVEYKADDEGTVSNIYDALVTGKSSSAGIAAAFTVMANANDVDAFTVAGKVTGRDGVSYWNQVSIDDVMYAVDCEKNDGKTKDYLLVGADTSGFGSTHVVDMTVIGYNGPAVPAIGEDVFDWPDDRSFFEKYGEYIFLLGIVLLLMFALWHAKRSGYA